MCETGRGETGKADDKKMEAFETSLSTQEAIEIQWTIWRHSIYVNIIPTYFWSRVYRESMLLVAEGHDHLMMFIRGSNRLVCLPRKRPCQV